MKRIVSVLFLLTFSAAPSFGQFIENKGQVVDLNQKLRPEVEYYSGVQNASVFFEKERIVFNFREKDQFDFSNPPYRDNKDLRDSVKATLGSTFHRIDLKLIGTNEDAKIKGESKTNHYNNYFLNKRKDIQNVKSYNEVRYSEVYPNIDLLFHFSEKGLKYDFILKEGADIEDVKFRYEGAKNVTVGSDGELHIKTNFDEIHEAIPLSFFDKDSSKTARVTYDVGADNTIGFSMTNDAVFSQLTIDPFLTWGTYFEGTVGDNELDYYSSIADDLGNYFVEGWINNAANDYPTVDPGGSAYFQNYVSNNLYIAKFDANRSLVWATYYGGSTSIDWSTATDPLAISGTTLHFVGSQLSTDAPLVNGGGYYYGAPNSDPYWLRLNKNSGALLHATAFPSHTSSQPSIATSNSGLVAIIQQTYDFGNPEIVNRPGAYNQAVNGGFQDMHIMLFNSSYALTWATFLGGPNTTDNFHVTFDDNDNIFFVGEADNTFSPNATNTHLQNFPGSYYQSTYSAAMGGHDLILGKFNSSGALVWHTLYGGDASDGLKSQMGNGSRVIIDPDTQDLLVIGGTNSSNFPLQNLAGAYNLSTPPANNNPSGGSFWDFNSFILKFNNDGARNWGTYWGDDPSGDLLYDGVFAGCNKFIVSSRSDNHTTTPLPTGYNQATGSQGFLMQFDENFSLDWSSYVSEGMGEPSIAHSSLDNRLYIGGSTFSEVITTLDPGSGAYYDDTNDDSGTGSTSPSFVIYELDLNPQITGANTVCVGQTISLSGSGTAAASNPWVSSNNGVATVDNSGNVTGQSAGTATITYTDDAGCSANFVVTVSAPAPAPTISSNSPVCIGGTINLSSNTISGATYNWTGPNSFSSSLEDPSIPSATSAMGGTYNLFVTVSGCPSATASTSVTINTNSIAPTGITGTTAICSGSSTTLTLSGGSAGTGATAQWYSGSCGGTLVGTGNSVTVSPGTTTTYYVGYSGTCNTTGCANQTVTVTAPPNAGTLSGNQNICVGATTTFSSTQSGGSWSSSNTGVATVNTTSGVVTGQSGGTATITYTVPGTGGCSNATATRTVTVTAPPSAGTLSGNQNVCAGSTTTFSSSQGGGSWSSSNTGVATVNSSSGVVTGQSGGTATITYTVTGTGGCSNATATRTVTVTAPPNAGTLSGNQNICLGATTTFSSTQSGGSWSSSNTGVATVNTTSGVVTGQSGGTATITYTVPGTGGCSNATATRTVTVDALPTVTVPSGGNLCEGETLNLLPSSGGTWTSSDAGVATIDNSGLVTGVSAGTADMTFTETSTGCTSLASSGTVTVNPLPTFSASVTDPTSCGATDGTITISGLNGSTAYDVSLASGTPTIETSNGAGEIVMTGLGAGSYAPIEITLNGCSTIDNGTYDLNDPSSPSITVPNGGELCEGDTLNILPDTGGTWTSNDPSVATIDNTGILAGISAGTTTIIYTETSTGCSSTAADGSITVNPTPTVTIPDGGEVCEGASLSLTPNTGGTWTSSDASIATITNGGVVTGISAGTAEVTFINAATGCSSLGADGTVTVNAPPTTNLPTDNPICVGDVLNVSPSNGGTWLSTDGSIASITNNGEVTGISQGTTTVVFTDTTTGCSSLATDGEVEVNAIPSLLIGEISCNKPNGTYYVDYATDNGAAVSASVGTVNSTSITGIPNEEQVIITATTQGCPSAEETVSTNECNDVEVNISNGVSPNDDGINDVFSITNLDAYPNHVLTIYNRWGDKVFEASPYENEWSGENNTGGIGGQTLPAGTYFYVLELEEGVEPMKGYVELKK